MNVLYDADRSTATILPQSTADIMDDYRRDQPHLFICPWILLHPNGGQIGTFLTTEMAGNLLDALCCFGGWFMGTIKRFACMLCVEGRNVNSNIV